MSSVRRESLLSSVHRRESATSPSRGRRETDGGADGGVTQALLGNGRADRGSHHASIGRVGRKRRSVGRTCLYAVAAVSVLLVFSYTSGVGSDHIRRIAQKVPLSSISSLLSPPAPACDVPPAPAQSLEAPPPLDDDAERVSQEPDLPPPVPGFGAISNPANPFRQKFLVPIYACNEQETGSQTHVRQLLHLARAVNRTLVLPNWGFGAPSVSNCRPYAFDEIYETESANGIGLWNVPFPTWWKYVMREGRKEPITARMAIIFYRDAFARLTRVIANTDADTLTEGCVPPGPFAFTDPAMYVATRPHADLNRIMAVLSETAANEVVFVHLHYCTDIDKTPPFDTLLQARPVWGLWSGQPWPQWNYSAQIYDIARKAQALLPPDYVAMQWRMELTPVPTLQKCSDLFAEAIIQGMRSRGRRTIYVATDMPLDDAQGVKAKSASFNAPEVQAAKVWIDHLLIRLREAQFDVRSWKDVIPEGTDPEFAEGASGIFDRLLLGEAARLYAANPYCGMKSSYLGSIQNFRQDRIGDPTETDWEKLGVTWIGKPIPEKFWWHQVVEEGWEM